jgi:thiol-disulfide isomerase/thioredoxin
MKRKPASSFTRQYISWFTWKKDAPLDLIETVCRQWIADRPQDPSPYSHLATAYDTHARKAEDIAPLIDKAIELYLADRSKSYDFDAANLASAFRLSADAAFKLKRYSQAVTAVKTAQALARDSSDAVYLLEARIWERTKQPALAEKAYRVAWRLGSKPAEDGLRAIYQKDKGTLAGFETWLNKEDNAPSNTLAKRAFPAFNLTGLDGKSYDLAALRGKVVVLNFWFIGCGPCKAEMPDLNQLVQDNAGKDVVFLAPALDEAESLRVFLKQTPFAYQVVAEAGTFAERQGIQSYPTHYVINQKGEVELTLYGAGEKNVTQIRNVLARLLSTGK